jgi:diguanylate cyclase (GGDEF)-like protein
MDALRPSGDERGAFLSTELPNRRQFRLALAAVLASSAIFFLAAPFARTPLAQVPAFIPIYVSALLICDLITAVLLLGQFRFLRKQALLVLAGGYLFTAGMTLAYALIFPGMFSPSGLFGAGPQTTSAMYMFWHAGFPLAVIAYAQLKAEAPAGSGPAAWPQERARTAIACMVAAVLCIACMLTYVATSGHALLPAFIDGDRTTDLGRIVLSGNWLLSLLALAVLWRRRPHTVLDLWLLVVMCVWLFDIALAAIVNTGRYDLGWYVGRIYGLLAASVLLMLMVTEHGKYYARLVQLTGRLNDANKALRQLSLHDDLTGLANRRYFDSYLADQVANTRRHKRALSLVLCDVDSFKAYNDHYGHQAGDACLKRVAAAIAACCRRPADMAARYGGEEFAMILPDTDLEGAKRIAETARQAVAQLRIPHAHSAAAAFVSISGGVADLSRHPDATPQQLVTAADLTLYQAKRQGRNRMISVQDEP